MPVADLRLTLPRWIDGEVDAARVHADDATRVRAQRFYDVCGRLGASVGAAALQFPLSHPAVATVVCGLRSTAEVDSAVQRMRAPLPPSLWSDLRNAGLLDANTITP